MKRIVTIIITVVLLWLVLDIGRLFTSDVVGRATEIEDGSKLCISSPVFKKHDASYAPIPCEPVTESFKVKGIWIFRFFMNYDKVEFKGKIEELNHPIVYVWKNEAGEIEKAVILPYF
ncbi:hypothetical protein GCM10008967_32920 [Bacillus carboniphilus]|uniref:DUF3221 domain-containing protein n=1 Tax=Bacillus carboniphilus TaxID=86663 RepID=A0ABN0WJR3_9BACI